MSDQKRLAVIDLETDPFEYGKIPQPFAAGFYSDQTYEQFWGDDCVEQLMYFLHDLKESHLIYAHNGGKFDFLYMLQYFHQKINLINGRIVKGNIWRHEMRDSYAALPISNKTL